MRSTTLAFTLASLLVVPAYSQPATNTDNSTLLAKQAVPARQGGRLTVTSSAFIGGGDIPEKHAKGAENMSPPLQWSKGPLGTRSYALIAEDAGASNEAPAAHWILYDIDNSQTRLTTGFPKDAKPAGGASQAKSDDGTQGYSGPNRNGIYHFQVFALSAKLNLDPEKAGRGELVAAMKGKVLASGDLIGRYTGK